MAVVNYSEEWKREVAVCSYLSVMVVAEIISEDLV